MFLSIQLGVPVGQMLREMSSAELTDYIAYFRVINAEREQSKNTNQQVNKVRANNPRKPQRRRR